MSLMSILKETGGDKDIFISKVPMNYSETVSGGVDTKEFILIVGGGDTIGAYVSAGSSFVAFCACIL